MEQKVPGSHRRGQMTGHRSTWMRWILHATSYLRRQELFEETSSLIYCPRCILEHAPSKEITPSKWVFGLRVNESKLSHKQFRQNRGTQRPDQGRKKDRLYARNDKDGLHSAEAAGG
jgi:hypothetical protein